MHERSIETIMAWMTTTVQSKQSIPPAQFVEAAQYLVILMSNETNKLYELEQKVAQMKVDLLKEHDKVNKVNLIVNATDEYKQMKIQQAKVKNIEETIRVAKLMGKMRQAEMGLN
jgi:hypothetical protein